MKLSILVEGDVTAANASIVSIKNKLAQLLAAETTKMGYRDAKLSPAEQASDDAILYLEVGNNHLFTDSQVVMIRVIADDDLQIQLPDSLSSALQISDYQKVGAAAEAIAILKQIQSKIHKSLVDMGHRPNANVGRIV